MAQAPSDPSDVTDQFIQFYRKYYRDEIGTLAQKYPNERRSLHVDYDDLSTFDIDLAEDYLAKPDQMQEYAEEALRLYDLPADVKLGRAHVRLTNLPETVDIRNIRVHDDHIGRIISVQGIVRKATDVRPKITEAAFECQRCGTMTYIPQSDSGFQEPHECQGCERQGPFHVDFDQSEFVDAQKVRVQESPEGLRGGETPQNIDVDLEDDVTGRVTAGDHVTVTGVLHIEQQTSNNEKTPIFDLYMDGVDVEIEDEEFEDMNITEADVAEIVDLSNEPDIHEMMVDSVAPSIYGYREEKLAMILQLFSGVTKHLPDGSRIRGDLHMLLIGDPGTGKSAMLQYIRNIAPRSVYTSGKGSSSAGLTAAAVRDDFGDGQQWTLEAGALVLADKGIAAVDELDKMRCVTGDTLVHTADGIRPIRELAYQAAEDGDIESLSNGRTIRGDAPDVWTLADDGTLVQRPVTAVHEYEAPEELYEVTLESGESVKTTADHPFFVFEDGDRVERAAEDLRPGDWAYVPEAVRERATDGGVIAESSDRNYRGSQEHSSDSGVPPSKGSILGYIAGDGNVYSNDSEGSYGIRFTNSEEQLLRHFESVCGADYDAETVRHPSEQRADGVGTVRLHGKEYVDDLLGAGLNLETYEDKRLPTEVTRSSRETKAAFIRALADSEATVGQRAVKIHSSSYELLLGTRMLLLEFGVQSQIQTRSRPEKRDLYVLAITSDSSLAAYENHIGFTLDRKQSALEEATQRTTGDRAILDVLPEFGDRLERLRDRLRLYQSECGLGDATYCNFENGDANPSLHRAEKIQRSFEARRRQASKDRELLADSTGWTQLGFLRTEYHVSQRELAQGTSYSQQQISRLWENDDCLRTTIADRLRTILNGVAGTDLERFNRLIDGDVRWRKVESVESVTSTTPDTRIPVIKRKLADHLGCSPETACDQADELLSEDPSATTWGELHDELERHEISFQRLAAELDVAGSTVSRWFSRSVDVDNFRTVRGTAFDLIGSARGTVAELRSEVEARRREPKVYDLTVQGTHNFVANGMIVHNSEDRSAMHEALEQQSYHPDSEILLSDGRRVEIGPFVDSMMDARTDEIVDGVDCEILPVDDVGVHTVDLDENEVEKVPVDRVSRHEAPEEFVRVSFSNGRSVTVTPEHPTFIDADGEVGTVDAADLTEGEYVPAPRKLPNSAAPMSLEDEAHRGKERDVDLPDEMSPALAEILGLLTAEGHSYSGGRTHEIGFSNQDERLLDRAGRLMDDVFGLDSTDAVNAAGTTTKRWVSTKLYRWFESNFPEVMRKSPEKRMPEAILGASEEEIRRFLVGAFAGDGGVESEAMSFSTTSHGLAEDYADALLKIGVASRIHHDSAEDSWKTYVMGDSTEQFVDRVVEPTDDRYEEARAFVERSNATERHHDVLPPSAAEELRSLKRLLGVPLNGRFRPNIDESYGVQISTVREVVASLRERIETLRSEIDAVTTLAEARELVGWSGRQLAERLSCVTTSAVHYAENGGYTQQKRESMRIAAVDAITEAIDTAARRLDDLESRCDLRYYRVTEVETVPNEGEHACEWVYDVTVEPTNTFVSGGVVLHNSISVSKAGINATLKSRCSLLGAANPKYGRFDQYEPIGEQIDLEPALISRFDLIFTVTDSPDPETDAELAKHIINTNYAGELHTQRTNVPSSEFTDAEVDDATADVTPEIDAELLRKYIAYAKRNCYPTMTDEAKEVIQQFYVDFRAKGADEDAPVPVTARKLEALVRLSEASARLRLSDTVEREDAARVTDIVESCLRDIGMDPETGNFDADIVETGTSKTQRDRIKDLKGLIEELEDEYDEGAPVSEVVSRAGEELGLEESKAEKEIENLRRKGEVYEPRTDYLRTT